MRRINKQEELIDNKLIYASEIIIGYCVYLNS